MPEARGYKAVALRLTANIVAPICAFLTGPILARTLGVEGRGELATILVPIGIAVVLLTSSHGEVLTAAIASRRFTTSDALLSSLLGAVLTAIPICAALYWLIPFYVPGSVAQATARWLLLLIPLAAVQACLRGIQAARHQHGLLVGEGMLSAVGRLLALAALAALGLLTVSTGAWISAAAMILPAAVLLRRLRISDGPRKQFGVVFGSHMKRSSQTFLGTTASQLNLRIDQALLAALAGPLQVGLYAVAVSIAELPVYGISALRQVLLSEVSDRQSSDLVARVCRTATWVTLAAAVAGAAVAYPALLLLYGRDFTGAWTPTVILLAATAANVPGGLLTTALVAKGRSGLASVPACVGLVATAVLAWPLLRHGAVGASWLSLSSYALTSVMAVVLFCRTHRMTISECLLIRRSDLRSLWASIARRRMKQTTEST